jgi:hypothetical protein
MRYEVVKPLRGRVNALRAVKKVKSFLTPEGRAINSMGRSPMGGGERRTEKGERIPLLWRGRLIPQGEGAKSPLLWRGLGEADKAEGLAIISMGRSPMRDVGAYGIRPVFRRKTMWITPGKRSAARGNSNTRTTGTPEGVQLLRSCGQRRTPYPALRTGLSISHAYGMERQFAYNS